MSLLADVLPTPTLVLDPLYLGWPALVVFPAIVAAAVLTARGLRRRGRGRGAAIAAGALVFVALDVVVYLVTITIYNDRTRELRDAQLRAAEAAGSSRQGP